jgi:antitoxin VapB
MGMNIKNDETHRLVRELAALTGESQTTAITTAVRERLERLRRGGNTDRLQRMTAIARDCAARFKEPYLSIDHGDLLYGEDGLPR